MPGAAPRPDDSRRHGARGDGERRGGVQAAAPADGVRRGALRRRRVRGRGLGRRGLHGPRGVAARARLQHPAWGGGAAAALRAPRHEILRRQGRHPQGRVQGRPRDAVAAALSLRRRDLQPADAPGAAQLRRYAGSDRARAGARGPLPGGELPQRDDPDQPRGHGGRARALRRILRRAPRPRARRAPRRGGHGVLMDRRGREVRPLPAVGDAAGGPDDARRRRAPDLRATAARRAAARARGRDPRALRAHAAAHALHRRLAGGRPGLSGRRSDHRRTRGARRRRPAGARRAPGSSQPLPGPLHHPPPLGRARRVQRAAVRAVGRAASRRPV